MAADDQAEIDALKARSLKKTLWVIHSRVTGEREAVRAHLLAHLRHQASLEKAGVLFAAGPLADEEGKPTGTSMTVVRAGDVAEARRIAEADPMHAAGVRSFTLSRWSINEGRIIVTVDIADGTASLA
jgi:uncharacterized protein YciI